MIYLSKGGGYRGETRRGALFPPPNPAYKMFRPEGPENFSCTCLRSLDLAPHRPISWGVHEHIICCQDMNGLSYLYRRSYEWEFR